MRRRRRPEEAAELAEAGATSGKDHLLPRLHRLRGFTTFGASPPSGLVVPQGTLPWCLSLLLARMTLPSAVGASREPPLCLSPQVCWHVTVVPVWDLLSRVSSAAARACAGEGRALSLRGTHSPVCCLCAVVSCHCRHLHVPCFALWPALVAQATDVQSQHSVNSCNHRNELIPGGKSWK